MAGAPDSQAGDNTNPVAPSADFTRNVLRDVILVTLNEAEI
ncbi:hypothetical protein ADIS_4571 [Lunatimonas lonarensis]|uniref:Uncharacterized protein n=1 Tax=Lunatimonas lonarensis TaxID=1232681 RepID=R7ZLK0_9BACT|nr:hypothetical protein ADIS_4571 [Lunatimonas lonarensis]